MSTVNPGNRKSNRQYPARKCLFCGSSYIPHDFRQKYCCEQHRRNFLNDKRRNENHTRFLDEKHLRSIDRILERLHKRMKELKVNSITLEQLLLMGIQKLDINVATTQTQDNKIVRWFYEYGLQAANEASTEFKISKRSKA